MGLIHSSPNLELAVVEVAAVVQGDVGAIDVAGHDLGGGRVDRVDAAGGGGELG